MYPKDKLIQWIWHMLIMSIPFWTSAIGMYVSKGYDGIYASNIYILSVAVTYLALQILWLNFPEWGVRYKSEMKCYIFLISNNLLKAVGNFLPNFGITIFSISSYEVNWIDYLIGGISFTVLSCIGYYKYRTWTRGNG